MKNLPSSEIELEGEIPVSALFPFRKTALEKLGETIRVDGFRKGHVPEKVILEKVGEVGLLGEVAELILPRAYQALIEEKGLDVIGRPEVTLTKLAPGNPIGFKIKTAVIPSFVLPDYDKIAKEVMKERDELEVSPGDVEKVLTEVRRGKARFEKTKEKAGGVHSPKDNGETEKDEELPELDDAFVATLGDFKNVEDFKSRVHEDLKKDKEQKAREKKRVALSEKLIGQTDIELPAILVENELQKMLAQMKDDVARLNMKFEDYLAHIKKDEEGLKKEWEEQAKKRAKLQLILNAIAKDAHITADHGEVHRRVEDILAQFKDANPDNVHVYVETQLMNEAVFTHLEGTSGEPRIEKMS